MNLKKWIRIIAVMGLLLVGISATTYGVSQGISRQTATDLESPENKLIIAQNVLADTGLSDRFGTEDIQDISIYRGNIDGEDGEDIVVSIEFGPTDTLVAAYQNTGDGYEYLGTVGTFFTVEDIALAPTRNVGKDFIIIREHANQRIGAFEDSTLIRGYVWKDGAFDEILKLPEAINTQWNRAWDSNDPNAPSQWERIRMFSDITFVGPEEPTIQLIEYQSHDTSRDTESLNVPADDTYFTVKERVVTQAFRWSEEWQRYILFEMIENSTGEKVAVLQDESASPYALLPEYAQYENLYQIIRKDGTREYIDSNALTPVDSSQNEAVFKSLP